MTPQKPTEKPQDQRLPRLTLSELLEDHEAIVEFGKTEESKAWESARAVGREFHADDKN